MKVRALLFALAFLFCVQSFGQAQSQVKTLDELSAFLDSEQKWPVDEASFEKLIEHMPLFARPVGDATVRFRSFLFNKSIPVGFKISTLRPWLKVEKLRSLEIQNSLSPSRSLQKDIKRQAKEARLALSIFLDPIAYRGGDWHSKPSLSERVDKATLDSLSKFTTALLDPLPGSARNQSLTSFLLEEHNRNKITFKTRVAEGFRRFPITITIQAMFAVIVAAHGGRESAEAVLSQVIPIDLLCSSGFLFLELTGLQKETTRWIEGKRKVYDFSDFVLGENKSLPPLPSKGSDDPATVLEAYKAFALDGGVRTIDSISALEKEVGSLIGSLGVSENNDLSALGQTRKAIFEKLQEIKFLTQALPGYIDTHSDVERIYLGIRYLNFNHIYSKIVELNKEERPDVISSAQLFSDVIKNVGDGSLDFDEAQILTAQLFEGAETELHLDLVKLAAQRGLTRRLKYLETLSDVTLKTRGELLEQGERFHQAALGLELSATQQLARFDKIVEESTPFVNQRLAREGEAERQRQFEAQKRAKAEQVERWIKEGKTRPDSIEYDLRYLVASIDSSVNIARNQQEHSRDGFGNVRSWFAANEGEMRSHLYAVQGYNSSISEIHERILYGLANNPSEAMTYLEVIKTFNNLLETHVTYTSWGGFGRSSKQVTIPVFDKRGLMLDTGILPAIAAGSKAVPLPQQHLEAPCEIVNRI